MATRKKQKPRRAGERMTGKKYMSLLRGATISYSIIQNSPLHVQRRISTSASRAALERFRIEQLVRGGVLLNGGQMPEAGEGKQGFFPGIAQGAVSK
jgi:hypothetical protein